MHFARTTLLGALLLPLVEAQAQDLDPRAYANTPVGLNFLVLGYAYAEGTLAFDPSAAITDAQYRSVTGVFAYARSLDAWGNSAKFDVLLPYTSFAGDGLVGGQPVRRDVSGIGDPRFRLSVNFLGSPALSRKEFASYRQDVIVGASVQVTVPLGQYDNGKLINLGQNRWSFKAELGISKAWGPWTVDLMPSVTVYSDNTDFNRGNTLALAPLYALQGHVSYSFPSGAWVALNSTYFTGNRTTLNGVEGNNKQSNSRAGLTFSMPVDPNSSVKLYASGGVMSRTGSDFKAVGIAWQYRWGDGF